MRSPHLYWDGQFNVTAGCTKKSPGCKYCWAESLHNRFHRGKNPKGVFQGPFETVQLLPERLDLDGRYYKQAMKGKDRTIFVCNSSDLFHQSVPSDFVLQAIMALISEFQHRFLILTKRPESMKDLYVSKLDAMSHLWFGTTVEDQKRADERIPLLLKTPARNRWLSVEPMLGSVDLSGCLENQWCAPEIRPAGVAWVVVGSESGAKRRHCNPEWIYSVVDQCQNAGVKVFVKQIMVDGKTIHKWSDPKFPEDLKIRELPWSTLNDER